MVNRTLKLRFREVNRDTFEAIKSGRKKVETRAATEKYRGIKKGDKVILICGKGRFEKQVKRVEIFKSIAALLRKYSVKQINSKVASAKELRRLYYTFPNYREKLKKHGLIALELK